jgi:hypothetical protein
MALFADSPREVDFVYHGKVISFDDKVDSTLRGILGLGEWYPFFPIEVPVTGGSGEMLTFQTVFLFEDLSHLLPVAFRTTEVMSRLTSILGVNASDLSILVEGGDADDTTTLDELDNPHDPQGNRSVSR